jgi:hypothetical protein
MAAKSPPEKHKTSPEHKSHRRVEIKHSRFSRGQFIIFAVIFAAIGGFAIWRALATNGPVIEMTFDGVACARSGSTCTNTRTVNYGSVHTIAYRYNDTSNPTQPTDCHDNWTGWHAVTRNTWYSQSLTFTGSFTWTVECRWHNQTEFADSLSWPIIVPPPPICSPSSQSVSTNTVAHMTASSGNGSYSWSAPGGNPSSGSGSSFGTQYSTTGTKTVTVSSAGRSDTCTVIVSNAIPGVPSNLHRTGRTTTSITMAWNASSGVVTGYKVYRNCKPPSLSCVPVGITSASVRSFKNTGLHSNTTYNYWVTAYNSTGQSGVSNELTTRTLRPRPTVSFSANPSSIPYNGYSYLQWNSTNADFCRASWTTSRATHGTKRVGRLTRTTTYSITCYNSDYTTGTTKSTTVHVGAPPSGCPPNCPTPPPPSPPKHDLAPPAPAPVVEEPTLAPEVIEPEPVAATEQCKNKNNHWLNLILGGLLGELISLLKHSCGQ